MDNWVTVKLTPSTFIISPSLIWSKGNNYTVLLVSATPLTVLYRLLWNFVCIFFMIWECACGLDVIAIIFFYFFPHCELSHFSPSIYRQWVPREHNSSYNFRLIFLELCTCFLHSLKMCVCFSYNPCWMMWHAIFDMCKGYVCQCTGVHGANYIYCELNHGNDQHEE